MAHSPFDVMACRADFPVFQQKIQGKDLVYLDTGASAQKPRAVIDAMSHMLECEYANVHRGAYWLSERSTQLYEGARTAVRHFVNAARDEEIIFTMGATDAINLVANTWARQNLKPGDAILITALEHHSNIVPWQMLRDELGLRLLVCPITETGDIDQDAYRRLLADGVKLVAMTHTSNVLGTIPPVREMIEQAHQAGGRVLLDGCQAVVHMDVDMQALDVDFYAFSSHKLYGPTGLGVLYGKYDLLEKMPPWRGGGDMIETVTFEKSTWAPPPARFEAGTPPITQTVGLHAAIEYVSALGMNAIEEHENALLAYATERLVAIPGLTLYGQSASKAGVLSFGIDGLHPHDVGMVLAQKGVCVRIGHHCAQPLMGVLGITATVRATLGLYNTRNDIDALVSALGLARELLA